MSKPDEHSGAEANQGFGPAGSPIEQRTGRDENPPALKEQDAMSQARKSPAQDGLDPEAMKKTVQSKDELLASEQLDEDLSVTGAPPEPDEGDQAAT